MSRLLESIKIKDGLLQNLTFHSDRVNETRRVLFKETSEWDLASMIQMPCLEMTQIYKCRILYTNRIDSVEFLPYIPRLIRKLYLVFADNVTYNYKFEDRSMFESLKEDVTANPSEDILIVKNGFITDTSYANIVFFDGFEWVTPDTPLLRGTKREMYLRKGVIRESSIRVADIHNFKKIRLINAMIDLEESLDMQIENIIHA